jgi:hypothetical protein
MRRNRILKIAGSGLATFSSPDTTNSSNHDRNENRRFMMGNVSADQLVSAHR